MAGLLLRFGTLFLPEGTAKIGGMKASTEQKRSPYTPPDELQRALEAAPKAKAAWDDLTPLARRDFIAWIREAKQDKTRQSRIERACENLAAGKRRPCCFAVVPMDFYKAMGANPDAMVTWETMDGEERRDLTDWIQDTESKVERQARIEEALAKLAAGEKG